MDEAWVQPPIDGEGGGADGQPPIDGEGAGADGQPPIGGEVEEAALTESDPVEVSDDESEDKPSAPVAPLSHGSRPAHDPAVRSDGSSGFDPSSNAAPLNAALAKPDEAESVRTTRAEILQRVSLVRPVFKNMSKLCHCLFFGVEGEE